MKNYTSPAVRILILLLATVAVGLISYRSTGGIIPNDPRDAMILQNALLLIVLGSAVIEHHFNKPADSVVNSLMGLISLISVYGLAPRLAWYLPAGYCLAVFILSITCVAVSNTPHATGWRKSISKFTYRPAVVFGRAKVLFTVVFLSGLWFFYSIQDQRTLMLVVFWGIFLAIWPLEIPALITSWLSQDKTDASPIGKIIRIDNPNILRASLNGECNWNSQKPKICCLPSGDCFWIKPLYSQFQENKLLSTGLLTSLSHTGSPKSTNFIYDPSDEDLPPSEQEITKDLGGGDSAILIGFVVEQSTIGTIRFEAISESIKFFDGMLVWANIYDARVYYQVIEGENQEESFSSDKHGYQVARAAQLGTFQENLGFRKHTWLPNMNSPVFGHDPEKRITASSIESGDFVLGKIPNSNISVGGNFASDFNYHTAILGVTGSGKTELGFDLIRHALNSGIKVVCIDLTDQYRNRLNDLKPIDLSIDTKTSTELNEKLFEAETGEYGGGKEKRALREFNDKLKISVSGSIEEFLGDVNKGNLGIIRLEEISNTKATLWITELFMTCLLRYAKDKQKRAPDILIVVEEAHTVMPEPNTMGLGDFDSRGLVGKISQIALQGRKYRVGLLVLAQRTATVSKTVLTQCNTIISFAAYDDTSLSFLRNIYGGEYAALVPKLSYLQAIAFGKWISSEKPIIFEIPFDQNKVSSGPD